VSPILADGLTEGRYPADAPALAVAVTADLQSVNGDKHLRLVHHEQTLPERTPGDDSEEWAAMARWAGQTCGGVACVRRLAGNVGYLDLQPVLFPAAIAGEFITAAMTLLAAAGALIIDLRGCLGGEPAMVSFLVSYLWDHEPAQLSGLRERGDSQSRQAWTLPYVPGRRPGKATPAYVLTSATTFSGGEQLSYDLQQLGRATIIGERTRGGANARQGFRVHPHLEATISVAEAVHTSRTVAARLQEPDQIGGYLKSILDKRWSSGVFAWETCHRREVMGPAQNSRAQLQEDRRRSRG
jgi:hypothetical protein